MINVDVSTVVNVKDVLRLVDLLQTQAMKAESDYIKRILLKAGCDIADTVLAAEGQLRRAA